MQPTTFVRRDACTVQRVLSGSPTWGFCLYVHVSGERTLTHWWLMTSTPAVTGNPHRTSRNELTIRATELPQLLSPCLHDIPTDAAEHETSPYPRHVQFLADQNTADIIRIRSEIIQCIRNFFLDRSFVEVDTPIIAGEAGGATARPFLTSSAEFSEKEKRLSLRIAPELWLKRLVIGGFDKVFEIGASFRNEGKVPHYGLHSTNN
jgi:lysyl-tRNA synthetase class 2